MEDGRCYVGGSEISLNYYPDLRDGVTVSFDPTAVKHSENGGFDEVVISSSIIRKMVISLSTPQDDKTTGGSKIIVNPSAYLYIADFIEYDFISIISAFMVLSDLRTKLTGTNSIDLEFICKKARLLSVELSGMIHRYVTKDDKHVEWDGFMEIKGLLMRSISDMYFIATLIYSSDMFIRDNNKNSSVMLIGMKSNLLRRLRELTSRLEYDLSLEDTDLSAMSCSVNQTIRAYSDGAFDEYAKAVDALREEKLQ